MISIHAPARGATFYPWMLLVNMEISIHAPARGATSIPSLLACFAADFNPRSREGSDAYFDAADICRLISIHAPARGATETSWY